MLRRGGACYWIGWCCTGCTCGGVQRGSIVRHREEPTAEGLRLRDRQQFLVLCSYSVKWKSRVDESIHRGTNFDTGGSYDNRNTPNRCHSKPHIVIDLSFLSSQRIPKQGKPGQLVAYR